MPKETAIVGDAGGCFLFNSLNYTITSPADSYILDAVALVFAKDKDKSPGTYLYNNLIIKSHVRDKT